MLPLTGLPAQASPPSPRRQPKALGYIYVDTGALYRTVALGAVRAGVLKSDDGIAALLPNLQVELKFVDGSQHVYLNGEDVSDLIRTPEISMARPRSAPCRLCGRSC